MSPVEPISEPNHTQWPKPPRVNIWRWLSPLLLVSLGLHGLSLLIPVPEKREAIEREEIEEDVVSIQVADLPPGALDPEPLPIEPPPIVAPPPVEPPPPAPIEPPPPEPAPLPPAPPDPPVFTERPPLIPDSPSPDSSTPDPPLPTPPTQQARVAPKSGSEGNAYAAAFSSGDPATGRVDGFAIDNGFTATEVASFRKLTNVLSVQFEPGENDNICLKDPPPEPLVTSFLATIAEEQGVTQINDAQILGRTGYDAVDDWISDSLIGFSDSVAVTPETVYNALSSNPAVSPASGDGYEMYYFEIDITLPPGIACS